MKEKVELDKKGRPTWEWYFMNITKEVAKRSTCLSGVKFGAIIVKDKKIISTGYNGAPRNVLDCYDRGMCLRRQLKIPSGQRYELCRSVHAEMNAIINAARSGVSILGTELYIYGTKSYNNENILVDSVPCFICKKMIINAGISRVIGIKETGELQVYDVEKDWVDKWSKNDMLEDISHYDASYYKKEGVK
jgi:dCMP deaminase